MIQSVDTSQSFEIYRQLIYQSSVSQVHHHHKHHFIQYIRFVSKHTNTHTHSSAMFENFSFNTIRSVDDSMEACSPFSPVECSPWSLSSQAPSPLFDPEYSLASSQPSRRKLSICTSLNNLSIHRSQSSSTSTPSSRYGSDSSINTGTRTQPHTPSSRSSSHPRSKTVRTVSHALSTDVRLQRMLLSQLQAMAPQTIAPRIPLSSPRSSRASSEDLSESDNETSWKRSQGSRSAPGSFITTKNDCGKVVKRKARDARQKKHRESKDECKWRFQRAGFSWA